MNATMTKIYARHTEANAEIEKSMKNIMQELDTFEVTEPESNFKDLRDETNKASADLDDLLASF